jgi:hypothetical protein
LPAEGDVVLSFCGFVEGLSPVPKAIRLFYHSPALEHVATTCPKGSRQTVQKALSPRFAALADPATVWAAHRVRTNTAGTTTLLYIEEEPRLARLKAILGERGIELEAAFPLLALLEAVPSARQLDQPMIALLHTDEAAAVYWRTAEGDRHAAFFDGTTTRERAGRELVNGFSVFKVQPDFTVVALGSAAVDLWPGAPKPVKVLSAEEFLAHAPDLGVREISNFLPPQTLFTGDHACHAAALVLLCIAATAAGTYFLSIRDAQNNRVLQQAEEQELKAENSHFRDNKAHIEAVNAVLKEVLVAKPVKRRFLEALNKARPPQISIRAVTLNETTWTVTGYAHEAVGLDKGPYQAFLAALKKNEGWTVNAEGSPAVIKEPEFTLGGTIP